MPGYWVNQNFLPVISFKQWGRTHDVQAAFYIFFEISCDQFFWRNKLKKYKLGLPYRQCIFVFETSQTVFYERINPLGETSQSLAVPWESVGEDTCALWCIRRQQGLLDRTCVTDASKGGVESRASCLQLHRGQETNSSDSTNTQHKETLEICIWASGRKQGSNSVFGLG